ncbi:MAG: helix-turn-helix transcriptional regulator [Firmicutes bacterium]|nr:helix-turn-helix transcriptional regulator [Bacillota bacterium]
MFGEKFDSLLKELDISSKALSEFMDCDKSYVNRIRAGSRNITRNGKAANTMINGVFDCISDSGKYDDMCAVINISAETSREKALERLEQWLFDGSGETKAGRKVSAVFSDRFKDVLKLANLSNIRLAKLLNIDASLVSRWRTGFSAPTAAELQDSLCRVLLSRINSQGNKSGLAELLSVEHSILNNDELAYGALKEWLFGCCDTNSEIVEKFLSAIDDISFEGKISALPFETAADKALLNDRSLYYTGDEGLQKAVIRFLGNAVRSKAKELWLYSDQSMNWMTSSKEFMLKWFSLMLECLKGGTKITVIHNIDRGFEEMTAAIKGWLPLYMTGNIRSYYSTRPGGGRFTNTIFLIPDKACIFNCGIAGQNEKARYDYITDENGLIFYKEMYTQLMKDCKELLKTYAHSLKQTSVISETKGVHIIQNTPSLATMPKELVQKLAAGNDALIKEWEMQSKRYGINLKNGFVHEYIMLPDDEALFGNTVRVDTTLDKLYYTPEDFSVHIKHILEFSKNHSNYALTILPEMLMKNCRLVIGEKTVIVEHRTAPETDFIFTHPLMRTAFAVYAEEIGRQNRLSKAEETQKLKQYL